MCRVLHRIERSGNFPAFDLESLVRWTKRDGENNEHEEKPRSRRATRRNGARDGGVRVRDDGEIWAGMWAYCIRVFPPFTHNCIRY